MIRCANPQDSSNDTIFKHLPSAKYNQVEKIPTKYKKWWKKNLLILSLKKNMSGIVLHSLIYDSVFKRNIVQFVDLTFKSLEHLHKSTFMIIDLDCDSFNTIVIDHLNLYSTVLYLLDYFHNFIFYLDFFSQYRQSQKCSFDVN